MAMRSISGRAPGTDPDYVPAVEVFDNLSHAEIYQAVRQLDPAALGNAGQLFLAASTGLGDEVENAHGEIRAAIADGWRGAAAQQAVDAIRDFEQAGRKIADVLTAVGVRLSQAGDAAESVRAAVAEPTAAQPDPTAALIDSEQAGNNAAIVRQAENARLDAVQAMETIYAGAFVPTGSGVPAFPDIPTEVGGAAAPAAGLGVTAGGPGAAAVASSPDNGVPVAGNPAATPSEDISADATAAAGAQTSGATTAATVYAPPGSTVAAAAQVQSTGATLSAAAPVAQTGGPAAASSIAPVGHLPATDPRARRVRPSTDRTSTGTGGATPISAATTHSAAAGSSSGTVGAPQTSSANSGGTDTAQASAEGRQDAVGASGDAAAGMSAGAIGGLMGGAMVAADHTRPPGGPRPQPRQDEDDEDDEDDFLRYLDEEPTYLEPADEVNALIGKMEPTSPAVLGEWTGRE